MSLIQKKFVTYGFAVVAMGFISLAHANEAAMSTTQASDAPITLAQQAPPIARTTGATTSEAAPAPLATETLSTSGTSNIGNNTLEAATHSDQFLDHVHASFFGNLHGPALNHLEAANTVDQNGKFSKNAMYLDSEVSAVYMLSDKIGVGAILPFFVYARGESTQLGDVGLKIASKKTISTSDFTLNNNLFIQMSSSDYSKNRGQEFAVKFCPNMRYIFRGTRYSLGAWTEAKSYVGVNSGKAFKLWAAPYISYQLSPKVSLNLQYELEADHFANKGGSMDFDMYQNDLVPSVVFNITPNLMVNPYLQIFTQDKISSDRMALGALVSASL